MLDALFDVDDYEPVRVKAMSCSACIGSGCARCDWVGRLGSSIWRGGSLLARIVSTSADCEAGSGDAGS